MTEMEKRRIVVMRSAGESYKEISEELHTNLAGMVSTNPFIFLRLNLVGKATVLQEE